MPEAISEMRKPGDKFRKLLVAGLVLLSALTAGYFILAYLALD